MISGEEDYLTGLWLKDKTMIYGGIASIIADRKKAVLADVLQLPLSYFFTMLLNILSAWIPVAESMAVRIAILLVSEH